MSDSRFFRQYLDIFNEASAAKTSTPAATSKPTFANLPGAEKYDVLSGEKAALQQNLQNVQTQQDARLQAHLAAQDKALAASPNKMISSTMGPVGPSGDPLTRSSVDVTDLSKKERQAYQDFGAAEREKMGGGFWQRDSKMVDTEMGPIKQQSAKFISTPTKAGVIQQGLQGTGQTRTTLHDPSAPKLPTGATGLFPDGVPKPTGPVLDQATVKTPAAGVKPPQKPVQEDELERLREFLRK